MLTRLTNWLNAHHLPPRLIISVIVGIAVAMALSMITHLILHWVWIYPPLHKPMMQTNLVLVALAYHSFYAMIAAYITAMLAKDKAKKAVIILGTKEAIMWVLGTLLLWHHTPPWYNITKAVLGVPIAMLGGRIYEWHRAKKSRTMKPATT